jgi:hypothetical protein
MKFKVPAPIWEQPIRAAKKSVSAERLTRAMKPSPPSAGLRMPLPPVGYENSLSPLGASTTSSALTWFEPFAPFVNFAVERDGLGHEALEGIVCHCRVILGLVTSARPDAFSSGCCAMRRLYTRSAQRTFSASAVLSRACFGFLSPAPLAYDFL